MIKERILLGVGILLLILPFLGFPALFRDILGAVLGVVVITIAYVFFVAKKVRMIRKQARIDQESVSAVSPEIISPTTHEIPTE